MLKAKFWKGHKNLKLQLLVMFEPKKGRRRCRDKKLEPLEPMPENYSG